MLDQAVCTLAGAKLFRDVSEADVREIEAMCVWREYATDEMIISAGNASRDTMFIVITGMVRVALQAGQTGEIAFIDLGPGDQFGELAALDGQSRSASVVARENSVVASLTTEQFTSLLMKHPAMSFELLQHLANIIRRGNDRIVDLSTRTDVQRVYSEILRLSEPDPSGDGTWLISRMPKHREIAAWAGTSEESVATALGQLIKVGLAKRRHPSLHIVDRTKVRTLAELS